MQTGVYSGGPTINACSQANSDRACLILRSLTGEWISQQAIAQFTRI